MSQANIEFRDRLFSTFDPFPHLPFDRSSLWPFSSKSQESQESAGIPRYILPENIGEDPNHKWQAPLRAVTQRSRSKSERRRSDRNKRIL